MINISNLIIYKEYKRSIKFFIIKIVKIKHLIKKYKYLNKNNIEAKK